MNVVRVIMGMLIMRSRLKRVTGVMITSLLLLTATRFIHLPSSLPPLSSSPPMIDSLKVMPVRLLLDNDTIQAHNYYNHQHRKTNLQFDDDDDVYDDDNTDDRHNKKPEGQNSTNIPVKGFSKIPSTAPSTAPSSSSSQEPSGPPSESPSSEPTAFLTDALTPQPTIGLSLHPTVSTSTNCQKDDYHYGIVSLLSPSSSSSSSSYPLEYTIYYKYSLVIRETATPVSTLPFSITDHIRRLESTLLELLVDSFFPECGGDGNDGSDDSYNTTDHNDNVTNNEDHVRRHEVKRFLNIFAPGDTIAAEAGHFASTNMTTNDGGDYGVSGTTPNIHESIVGISSRPIDLASGETCNDEDNIVSASTFSPLSSASLSCYVIDGKSTIYVSDTDTHLIPDIERQYLSTIQSLMEEGALDSSRPFLIVQVQFVNDTDKNEKENTVNDDYFSSYNNDNSSNKKINSFILFLLTGKLLIGLSTVAVFLAFLLVRRYRNYRYYYDRDKSLQDTESSSGIGFQSLFGIKGGSSNNSSGRFNNWRPSSGDAFVQPGDDDLVSCLSLQLEKSLENVASAPSKSNDNSSSLPPLKFLSLTRLLSFRREMERDQKSEGMATISSFRQVHGDSSLEEEQQQGHLGNSTEEPNEDKAGIIMKQMAQSEIKQGRGLDTHIDILSPDFGEELNQEKHERARRGQKYFRQSTNRTLNSIKFCLCSWKFRDINTRYYWYIFMFIIISIVIALVKVGIELVGNIGIGAQVLIVLTALVGVSIVLMILVYDQQEQVIDSSATFSASTL